jgi:hypothetical protein
MQALGTGLPMRRTDSAGATPWLHLGEETRGADNIPCWRDISTGRVVGLWRWDYDADDWEVMGGKVAR